MELKRAFTMIELILVIVILGIISFFTFEMTLQIFRSYTYSKMINILEAQTETMLEQIAKRLSYRIKESPVTRKGHLNAALEDDSEGDVEPLTRNTATSLNGFNILEFVPYAYEVFRINGYSGIADLGISSSVAGLRTPGSNLVTIAQNTFNDLVYKSTIGNGDLAVFFSGLSYDDRKGIGYYKYNHPSGNNLVARATISNNTALALNYAIGSSVSDVYQIAYTAYAIVPEHINATNGDFDLTLYYDYRPWTGQKFTDGQHSILARDVTRFNFMEDRGNTINMKLCIRATRRTTGIDSEKMSICKSKAVY